MTLTLHGYRYSVYTRVVRLVLAVKALPYDCVEIDPFGPLPEDYRRINPFGRVPALDHDGFSLYETGAIARYLDEAFGPPSLQPGSATRRARMHQIIAVIDNDGYWPMVRQVYARRIFGPATGEAVDRDAVEEGLVASRKVLAAIERLVEGPSVLIGDRLSLADLHLAPMVAAFTAAPEGQAMLSGVPKLSAWWSSMSTHPALAATATGLPENRSA